MDIKVIICIGITILFVISIICTTIKDILIAKSRDEKEMYISNLEYKKQNEEE